MLDVSTLADSTTVTIVVLVGVFVGLITAVWFATRVAQIKVERADHHHHASQNTQLLHKDPKDEDDFHMDVFTISKAIADGANAFLFEEYKYMAYFMTGFAIVLLVLLGTINNWTSACFSTLAFVCGVATSVLSGFIGMRIAVFTNSRTALSAQKGYEWAFDTAFKGGAVMGFALVSLGLIVLFILINAFQLYFSDAYDRTDAGKEATKRMYEALAGYGLGGSSVALFGRVGGGIYTKAADVGADLAGKVEAGLREDDPRNPAVIADNVGDNVGDIAGMGADLFGSFAESSCAAMVISSQSNELYSSVAAMSFPLVLTSSGILVCLATSFVATHLIRVHQKKDVESTLKRQLLVSTFLMTPVVFGLSWAFFPEEFTIGADLNQKLVKRWYIFFCVCAGLWSGLIIGLVTEYYTSHSYTPVRDVAKACGTGAATNIIYGLALGYKSVIVPVFCLAGTIYVAYSLAGMYGIAVAALGILSTLAIGLTIDAYGPICDNAGGIAEMSGMPHEVRDITDALDAAGNTTAAIGKGFAIGSAALVSLALFGAFVTTVGLTTVDILQPFQFAGLLVGAMLPYWFSAMTMKSVGIAALAMVEEVRRQFNTVPIDRDGKKDFTNFRADYTTCVAISTKSSLQMMVAPGALVMLTPIIVGFLFGVEALAGVLAGSLVSGVQMAISAANTGGAWDNAKKYIEGEAFPGEGKGSDRHKAAVVGDTVGDPLKDTSGPALNILIKLMAIISLVFAPAFPTIAKGGLLKQLFSL
jgi:inorganic pyrophosphatase